MTTNIVSMEINGIQAAHHLGGMHSILNPFPIVFVRLVLIISVYSYLKDRGCDEVI
jgi:uncharacterized membrane protein